MGGGNFSNGFRDEYTISNVDVFDMVCRAPVSHSLSLQVPRTCYFSQSCFQGGPLEVRAVVLGGIPFDTPYDYTKVSETLMLPNFVANFSLNVNRTAYMSASTTLDGHAITVIAGGFLVYAGAVSDDPQPDTLEF